MAGFGDIPNQADYLDDAACVADMLADGLEQEGADPGLYAVAFRLLCQTMRDRADTIRRELAALHPSPVPIGSATELLAALGDIRTIVEDGLAALVERVKRLEAAREPQSAD